MSALSYTECDIERSAVASARETFEELYSLITGRSGDYNTITTPVGFEFSDQIGEGLRTAANENQYAWSSSMLACLHAYGVLDKISADVKWYEDKIEEIKGDLSTALANSAEPDNLNIAQQIIESHDLQAEQAWRDLETRCDESQDMLKEGPTPENIRALGDGGYFGNNDNIGFYATGDFDYYVVDEGQAGVIATHLGHAVLDGNEISIELLEDNPEYLALVAAVVSRGLLAQQNGDRLLGGEVEFLETLFGDLDEIGGDSPGFLQFMDQVNSSEHISDSLREDINRNLANSMLILSDEDIGGGVGNLPQDVQEAAVGPSYDTTDFTYEFNAWAEDFVPLSEFLSHSGPGVQGGTEFSTSLLATSHQMLSYADMGDNPHMDPISQEAFSDVIGVASRNEEANYIILTGEDFDGNTYQHHENHPHVDPEAVLRDFYTYNWNDDGAAVRGITDWIADRGQESGGVTDEIRGTALAELMGFMEDKEFREDLFGTGHRVVEEGEEGEDDLTWLNVSAGHLNPELASGFSDIFLSYMDEFSETDGVGEEDENGDREGESFATRWNPDTGRVELSPESRLAFTQIIMGDEETATRVYEEVLLNTGRTMEEYASNTGERDHIPTVLAGSLQGLVEEALSHESSHRTDSHKEAADYRNKVTGGVIDILGGGAGDAQVPGFVVEIAKFAAKEALSVPVHEATENADTVGEWARNEQMQGFAISALANSDPELMARLEADGIARRDASGELYVPIDHADWDVQTSAGVLATEFDSIDEIEWSDGEGSTANAVYNFLEAFGNNSSKWEKVSY
ncbi:hypothetical protein ABZ512_02000 [Nocardiopsis dassonvillei]|uniref:TPR repeat region-containing protein n=1 Tax=Nocardiopsis dassonvillei TaxID=2014 RepID=UPI00340486E9